MIPQKHRDTVIMRFPIMVFARSAHLPVWLTITAAQAVDRIPPEPGGHQAEANILAQVSPSHVLLMIILLRVLNN